MTLNISALPQTLSNFLNRYITAKTAQKDLEVARKDVDALYSPTARNPLAFPPGFPFFWKRSVKYVPSSGDFELVPKQFKKKEIVYTIDREAVEVYAKKHGKLPPGITSEEAYALSPQSGAKILP